MADKKTSGNGNGNGSSSHEYINEAGIGNADDEDYCKKVYTKDQSYEIKSPPWTILWFRILGIFSVENIKRLCVFMFQT